MLYEIYTQEKLRELERARRALMPGRRAGAPFGAGLIRVVGRLLRRFGAGIEVWAERPADPARCCKACG